MELIEKQLQEDIAVATVVKDTCCLTLIEKHAIERLILFSEEAIKILKKIHGG